MTGLTRRSLILAAIATVLITVALHGESDAQLQQDHYELLRNTRTMLKAAETRLNQADTTALPQDLIMQIRQRITVLEKAGSADVAALTRRTDALKARLNALRAKRTARIVMLPSRYNGEDEAALHFAAESVVKAAHPDAELLRTSLNDPAWQSASGWKSAQNKRAGRFYATTRTLHAQVAAKTSKGVMLWTIRLSQEQFIDGSWDKVRAEILSREPVLEQNVR